MTTDDDTCPFAKCHMNGGKSWRSPEGLCTHPKYYKETDENDKPVPWHCCFRDPHFSRMGRTGKLAAQKAGFVGFDDNHQPIFKRKEKKKGPTRAQLTQAKWKKTITE